MNTPFNPNANGAVTGLVGRLKGALSGTVQRLSPRQRQYVTLAVILAGGVGLLWLIFALTDTRSPATDAKSSGNAQPATVTNIGVMPPGQQVNPVDQWVGTAGRKLAQYENERDEQTRLNKDRQAFEARTMQRFAELEQKLTSASQAASMPAQPNSSASSATNSAPGVPTLSPTAAAMPPASSLPLPQAPAPSPAMATRQSSNILPPPSPGNGSGGALPLGEPGTSQQEMPVYAPVLTRISLMDRDAARATPAPTAALRQAPRQRPWRLEQFRPFCPSASRVAPCWVAWMPQPEDKPSPTPTLFSSACPTTPSYPIAFGGNTATAS